MTDSDDDVALSFGRGDDPRVFLQTVPVIQRALTANKDGSASEVKLIAKAISVCKSKERKVLLNWKRKLTPPQLITMETIQMPDPGNAGAMVNRRVPGHETWAAFSAVFLQIFPPGSTSAQVRDFLTMKQQAVLDEYIPEYEMAAADAGVVLLMDDPAAVQQKMHLINSLTPCLHKVIKKCKKSLMI